MRNPIQSPDVQQSDSFTCLCEFNFGISLDSTLIANGPVFIEKIHVVMNETKAVIREAFYDFIRDAKNLNTKRKGKRSGTTTVDADDVYQRIYHIIPRVSYDWLNCGNG